LRAHPGRRIEIVFRDGSRSGSVTRCAFVPSTSSIESYSDQKSRSSSSFANRCLSAIAEGDRSLPSLHVAGREDADEIPADTPRIDAARRAETLARRRRAVLRRYRR